MISNNNDIGNAVNNVINMNALPHINNINPALLRKAAELFVQARNANVGNAGGTVGDTHTEVRSPSSQDDNVTIANSVPMHTTNDVHPPLLGEEPENLTD